MKRFFLLFAFCCLILFSSSSFAFEHGYESNTDTTYAMVRQDVAIYDSIGGDFISYLPSFSGIEVLNSSGSWYEIRYESNSVTHYGWITKEDFTYNCLIYDGREKQILANGNYTFRYFDNTNHAINLLRTIPQGHRHANASFTCHIEFLGDDNFRISRNDTGQFLLSDSLFINSSSSARWGKASEAGTFHFIRKGNYLGIQDTTTNRYLGLNETGLLDFTNTKNTFWRLYRTQKAVGESNLRDFVQFDPEWASVYYGKGKNPDPSSNNFCTSGCGIFATMNAIYSLTGQYVNPRQLANYAVEKYYRIEGYGTDSGFFKAAAEKFGYQYGFSYDGSGESLTQLKEKLKAGDTAITYVPGHYTTIVDYNDKTKKFLLLDPHYLPKRGTCSFGDWVSEKDLTEGNLFAQMFFYYKTIED